MKKNFFLLFILIFGFIETVESKPFRNSYISFDIPERWNCNIEQTEWVCRSDDSKESRESIIILTAKEVGPTDTYALYEGHLISPIVLKRPQGQASFSKPFKKPEYVQINGHKWLDGFHLESEIPNYFTRYLITIKDNISVLVTFSAHKDDYAKYSSDFAKTIQSLRVVAEKGLAASAEHSIHPSGGSIFTDGGSSSLLLPSEPYLEQNPKTKKDKSLYIVLACVLAAIGIYILRRK